jgi:peptide methionine sulfoxide reductase msrA/msrB
MERSKAATRQLVLRGTLVATVMIALAAWAISPGKEKVENTMALNKLTPEEERVILHKGTEPPFTGKFDNYAANGTYTCKQCGAPLYRSSDKFDAGCGWPAFDDEIPGAVAHSTDADGMRAEISCARCGAHLGHVFTGERFTPKNVRHCVNSVSLDFVPADQAAKTDSTNAVPPTLKVVPERAYFAGGCFWGTEYLLAKADGVLSARVGYMGGHTTNPTYREVCDGRTGHAEAVEVVYDPTRTSYETLARLFFEVHDPTQKNRQGPDIGEQYRSAVFYVDDAQRLTAARLIGILKERGYDAATEVTKAGTFWPAEEHHQDYYDRNGKQPYCHVYQKRF